MELSLRNSWKSIIAPELYPSLNVALLQYSQQLELIFPCLLTG